MSFAVALILALVAALNPFVSRAGLKRDVTAPPALFLGHVCGQAPAAGEKPAPATQHDCLLCPDCLGAAQAALIPAPPSVAPPELHLLLKDRVAVPARAPPAAIQQAAYPRGPPSLI